MLLHGVRVLTQIVISEGRNHTAFDAKGNPSTAVGIRDIT